MYGLAGRSLHSPGGDVYSTSWRPKVAVRQQAAVDVTASAPHQVPWPISKQGYHGRLRRLGVTWLLSFSPYMGVSGQDTCVLSMACHRHTTYIGQVD